MDKMNTALKYIQNQLKGLKPEIGAILGSGLGDLADEIPTAIKIPYHNIPGFPISTVEGHSGQIVIGELSGKMVLMLQGRFHYYEGYSMSELTMPVRIMKLLGINRLIVTNAAGGVNKNWKPGDLMIIKDHINFTGVSPLVGKNLDMFGPRFPDMSEPYNQEAIQWTKDAAKDLDINIREGVYLFNSGPAYETPAEVKMARVIGADAVGMSTVPEVIVANHCGMKVLGISCITNMAAGILDQSLDHKEVIETTTLVKNDFTLLIKSVLKKI